MKNKGFTLIELLVTIAVIGVMAAAGIGLLNPVAQLQKAADARRKTDLAQIQRVLEQFYQDNNGRYPCNPDGGTACKSPTGDYRILGLDGNAVDWGFQWGRYISVLPKDPGSSKKYVYVAANDGQSYYLYASLDQGGKDLQACNVNGTACSGAVSSGAHCCTDKTDNCGVCNYGVSSPNVSP